VGNERTSSPVSLKVVNLSALHLVKNLDCFFQCVSFNC